jgi:indolepyruvate ferredoxin oxidoreductase
VTDEVDVLPRTAPGRQDYVLEDRWRPGSGPVVLTGIQAVARLLQEQELRDRREGRATASFVSGYQGSPLGGLDRTLAAHPTLASEHGMRLVPALNEELAATAVWGSQSLMDRAPSRYDGVVGVWYGKAPGVDRSGDAFRHGNLAGAHPQGGVLLLCGDDPAAKSSSVPCASEPTLAALHVPVLYPRNAAEVITLGLYGIALSRASGCWVGMKVVTDVADGLWTVEGDVADVTITVPEVVWQGRPWTSRPDHLMAPPNNLASEVQLTGPRWEMVRAFLEANPVNAVEVEPPQPRVGILAAGKSYDTVLQALADLGLDRDDLRRAGVRVARLGAVFPLQEALARRVADGVERLLVVEEKGRFVEAQLRDLLYGSPSAPQVWGGRDGAGAPLLPADGELTAARLAAPLRRFLADVVALRPPPPATAARLSLPLLPTRVPSFCSGCSHNRSTVVPEGSLAGGGIGCHAMTAISGRPEAAVTAITQMGGEGAQWIGQAPFLDDVPHIFQNLGDGTYFHSGQLAVQACVAAGVDVTFKLLYNAAVAMTGGQQATGELPVPALTRKLLAEGVTRVLVVADDPRRYLRRSLPRGVEVWHRDRLDEAQRLLRDVPGVTVLVYDQQCAAEARRLRKRGALPTPTQRVVINEAVCEGCGDCGAKSNCLSVHPVETEFGRKTRIDQDSCNTDLSCLQGDCPSFVTVQVQPGVRRSSGRELPAPPAAAEPVLPPLPAGTGFDVFLAGIGGTGIVTVNQVLATAALLDGVPARGLDQTGLSQKAGPVTSHLRLGEAAPANRIGPGQVDCFLGFDLLVAVDERNLAYAASARTAAVVSTSTTPTATMVRRPDVAPPSQQDLLGRLQGTVRGVVALDALRAAERLLGSTAAANLLVVGAAYQAGTLPLTAASIERAIELNGVAVAANLAAFRWGRAAVDDPDAFAAATGDGRRDEPARYHLPGDSPLTGEVRRLVEVRAAQLVAHSGRARAREYVQLVEAAYRADEARGGDRRYSEAVARGAHKLMAYKDEYEVARLLADPAFLRSVQEQVPDAVGVRYQLHPPALRAAGFDRKIALSARWRPALRLLAHGRVLRGTPFDPFGRARVRVLERALVAEYLERVRSLTDRLDAVSYETAVALAASTDLVRGYESVKERNVALYRARVDELLREL